MTLDNNDQRLLLILQENCKRTTKQMAEEMGISLTAVYERIKKLESNGVITKYVAILDENKLKRNFVVLCHIKLTHHKEEMISLFESEIMNMNEIMECYRVSGDYDYSLKIHMKDVEEYKTFMMSKLMSISNIASINSTFTLSKIKHKTNFSL